MSGENSRACVLFPRLLPGGGTLLAGLEARPSLGTRTFRKLLDRFRTPSRLRVSRTELQYEVVPRAA